MEKVSAHTVSATTFCLHSSAIRSRIHFFPSAGMTTGPYSITCTFTLFGKGVERKSVAVDGGRLGQPDGIRLEDAFPALRGDISGVFGLQLELSCQQQRVNMLPSQASVELVSPQFSVLFGFPKFTPVDSPSDEAVDTESEKDSEVPPCKQGVGILDSFTTTSLIVINPSKAVVKPNIFKVNNGERSPLHVGTVAAESAVEIPLEESLLRDSQPFECSWGLMRSVPFYIDVPTYSEVQPAHLTAAGVVSGGVIGGGGISGAASHASSPSGSSGGTNYPAPHYYLLYRDPATKRPVSASAL
jgi:hypothetical protein